MQEKDEDHSIIFVPNHASPQILLRKTAIYSYAGICDKFGENTIKFHDAGHYTYIYIFLRKFLYYSYVKFQTLVALAQLLSWLWTKQTYNLHFIRMLSFVSNRYMLNCIPCWPNLEFIEFHENAFILILTLRLVVRKFSFIFPM